MFLLWPHSKQSNPHSTFLARLIVQLHIYPSSIRLHQFIGFPIASLQNCDRSVSSAWMDDEGFVVLQRPDRGSRSLSTVAGNRMNPPPPPPPPPRAPTAAATAAGPPSSPPRQQNPIHVGHNVATQTNDFIFNQQQQQQQQQHEEEGKEQEEEHEQEEEEVGRIVGLKVRSMNRGEIVKILVMPNIMQQEDFANCIAHAALSPSDGMKLLQTWSSTNEEDIPDFSRIAGLFRQRDGAFIPLSILLNDAHQFTDDVFCISLKGFRRNNHRNTADPQIGKRSGLRGREMILYAIIASYIGYKFMTGEDVVDLSHRSVDIIERIFQLIVNLPSMIVNRCIEYPLREMYRYGPSVIGWEGQPLALICSQVTHMGDESFWRKNMDECQKIYVSKEDASLHYRKPLVYLCLAYMLFLVIQSLVRTNAIRRQNRPHPEMVETYEAFRLLMRVLQRGLSRKDDGRRGRYR